jgi:hypothetical protein
MTVIIDLSGLVAARRQANPGANDRDQPDARQVVQEFDQPGANGDPSAQSGIITIAWTKPPARKFRDPRPYRRGSAGLADVYVVSGNFFTRRAVCLNSPTLLALLRPHRLGGLPRVQALLRLLPEIVGTALGTGILRPETGAKLPLLPRTETGIGKTEDKRPRQWRAFLDGLRKVRKQQTGWWAHQGSNLGPAD